MFFIIFFFFCIPTCLVISVQDLYLFKLLVKYSHTIPNRKRLSITCCYKSLYLITLGIKCLFPWYTRIGINEKLLVRILLLIRHMKQGVSFEKSYGKHAFMVAWTFPDIINFMVKKGVNHPAYLTKQKTWGVQESRAVCVRRNGTESVN